MNVMDSVVMEGSFESYSLDEVLDVISLTRQCMEIVVEDGPHSGRFVVRSGRLLDAESPPARRGRSAFCQLYGSPGRSFVVYRRDGVDVDTPIGALSELVAEARQAAGSTVEPASVLQGEFEDHTLLDVMSVIAMSRQVMCLTLHGDDDRKAVVWVKAGRLLACAEPAKELTGVDAFRSVVSQPWRSFQVLRVAQQHALTDPLGSLDALMVEPAEAEASVVADTILEGDFATFSREEVLTALSLTRQRVRLVFHRNGEDVGHASIQSGRVVSAVSGDLDGEEAFGELYHGNADAFVVVREDQTPVEGDGLGSLAALVAKIQAPAEPEVASAVAEELLVGSLSDWTLEDVFQVACLSRRLLQVQILRGGHVAAEVVLKAGQVLQASCGDVQGLDALDALWELSEGEFVVAQRPANEAAIKSLGAFSEWFHHRTAAQEHVETEAPAAPAGVMEIEGAPVLADEFASVSVDDLLAVVAFSRQCMAVDLFKGDARHLRLMVKSGRLIAAERPTGASEPLKALSDFLAAPGDRFEVYTVPTPRPLPAGIELAEARQLARDMLFEGSDTQVRDTPSEVEVAAPEGAAAVLEEPDTVVQDEVPAEVVAAVPGASHADVLAAVQELHQQLTHDDLEARLSTALRTLEVLEAQLAAQREALVSAPPRSDDRWLVGLVVSVQVLTLIAVAFAASGG